MPEKYPPGTAVMSTAGPCEVVERYEDGDYAVSYPELAGPQTVYSVSPAQI